MAHTQVILTEPIPGLGVEADVVKVKPGYARNFLIPSGKAFEVTPGNLKQLNNLKAKRAEREARELNEAEELARRINKLKITLILETGETGKAFGSITAKDIADRLKAELGGSEIERHRIVLERPDQGHRRARARDQASPRCDRASQSQRQILFQARGGPGHRGSCRRSRHRGRTRRRRSRFPLEGKSPPLEIARNGRPQ